MITKFNVDKAANCLCVMCKTCYTRVATAESNGSCEDMAEVRVRVRDAGVSGSWEAVLRFFLYKSSLLMTRAEEVPW